ncbi:MAG: hypothetical protein KIT84_34285 [Labilithrix sp.]|nr:hypothetical protein [Labilithrix sp.]MCW5816116.1 hypothetical protein [Labilithrix sp.]
MLARTVDRALSAIAIALAISIAIAGWCDVSQAYDVWYYHLPFAGRMVGLLDARSFAFSAENQVRYEGFPLFMELLQGVVWRVTDNPAATSFVAIASLFGLPVFLRRLYGTPLHVSLLALLAIPLVQIHATSAYVDLPANVCVTMLLLLVHRVLVDRAALTWKLLAGAAALAAAAANSKFQLVPIVAVSALVFTWLAIRARDRRCLAVLAIAAPLVLATPLKNLALHDNPVWPVELTALGHRFPSAESAYSSAPAHLESSWRATRFVRSVLEIDNRPIASHARWSLDQWTPPSEPGYRMGGYFGAYVVALLGGLGWAAWKRRRREDIVAAALFGGVTVVAALVPQSHELRYYMYWMITLVALNLALWGRERRVTAGVIAFAALAVVAWSTSGGYLYASGSSFADFLAQRVDRSVFEGITPGARLCVQKQPFNVLYAPRFHPELPPYTVQEQAAPEDCR